MSVSPLNYIIPHVAQNIPKGIATIIYKRDEACVRCKSKSDLTIDHIFPRSCGGTNRAANLRVLCRKCNSARPTHGLALDMDLARDGLNMDDRPTICGWTRRAA